MGINISKTCAKCSQVKNLTEFSKCKANKDGLQNKCKLCITLHYQNNKETYKSNIQKWNLENPTYQKDYQKKWYLENKQATRKQRNINQKNYREQNPHIIKWRRLLENTIDRLNQSKESSTNNLLKYSAIDLKEHLDKQGMDWDNHEIDHKIPVTWFIKTTPPNIVNDLRNLQPLSKEENTTKGNKYSHQVNKEYYNLVLKYIKEDFKESLAF